MKAVMWWVVILGVQAPGMLASQADTSVAPLELRARADSNDPLALYDLAHAYLNSGRTDEAQRLLETAVQIDGEFAAAYALLARIRVIRSGANGVFSDRFAVAHPSALAGSPDSATLLFRRSALLEPMQELDPPAGLEQPASWRSPLWGALQEFWHGRFDQSAAKLEVAIAKADRKHHEPPPVALWYHALSEYSLQHVDSSIVDLERLLDAIRIDSSLVQQSTNQRVRYALAYLHQQVGHTQVAESLYQQVIEHDLSLDLAHMQLARLYETAERWPDAVRERRAALMIAPDDPTFLYDLGVTLLEARQLGDAAETLRRVIARCPRNTRAYYALGLVLERMQQPQSAGEAYDRFLQLAPSRYADMIADAKARREHLPQ